MDLELADVRAVLAAVDNATMTAAAGALNISQQALSKRIAKLEATTGPLFVRTVRGVTLTERGDRFLPHARRLLATAEDALTASADSPTRPLRVDVWGYPHPPRLLVQRFARTHGAAVQMSMRRDLVHAISALRRDELDVAFGNVANLAPRAVPADVQADLVCFTEGVALVHAAGPFAAMNELRPADLAGSILRMPLVGTSPEVIAFMSEYALSVGMRLIDAGANIGVDSVLDRISADRNALSLVDAAWPVPADAPLQRVPISPVPLYPWYAVRRRSHSARTDNLVAAVRRNRSLRHVERDHWVPAAVKWGSSQ